jgi:hypothetical protein
MAQKKQTLKIILLTLIAVFILSCKPLAFEYTPAVKTRGDSFALTFSYAKPELWNYLRSGLNYLESPSPLLSPESIPPTYIHPDSKGFGAYGFSPAAFEDVQRLYPYFEKYSWQDIMASPKLYDLANQAFADWLLKNLQDYLPEGASKQQVFQVLHQAWNLGLSGFKNGRKVVASRTKRALEFAFNLSPGVT